jgi:alpha-1,2-mannosyltransferase
VLALCVAAYAVLAAGPWWDKVKAAPHGRDFASYYYAVQVAADGGDPYNKRALGRAARADQTRKSVHPFFYPPPYVLALSWVLPLDLETAFRAWYALGHLFLLAALLALWKLVPGRWVPAALGVFAVTFTPIADSHWMGQANILVMALALWGIWATRTDKPVLGGSLVGLAAMLKMSPVLLVAWWALHRRWSAVGAAVGTAIVLTLLSLLVVDVATQWRFYGDVLPGFARGQYHGLTVPIGLMHNHSIPNLLHGIWPGTDTALSSTARWVGGLISLSLLGLCAWRFRNQDSSDTTRLLQASTIVVLMLVLPTYTYEHHMVWMLLPYIGALWCVAGGRLRRIWLFPIGLAYAVQALQLTVLKGWYPSIRKWELGGDALVWLLRESKCFTALGLGVLCFVVAELSPRPSERTESLPRAAHGPDSD